MHPVYQHIKKELSSFYAEGEASAMAKWISSDILHLSTMELYTGKDMNFSTKEWKEVEDILARLKQREPLQYILQEAPFCGLSFHVEKGVLIPRPETEELVEWIVSDCQKAGKVRILDIGTGSGCIPVALAERLPEAEVASCDISAEALRVAAVNVKRYGGKVTLFQADILQDELPDCRVDVLVSNPPYITESERGEMEANVLDWEPELALFVPDTDPLCFYRRIARKGFDWLTEGGALYFEINRAYGAETVRMLEECGYRDIALRKDLSGNDRMIKAVRP
ncbi:MAG TPA: peptide chain release factor N(5)-glutamine methyltransferase [Bacteroides mediterraneensis]|uniref:peptide chain release factor N(5)-glutamine methyltransferase n=1 Tax=Bacteroides mediterraneensis TaxID=1841856 RepID=UPI00262AED62|nr:peptide chain release factor N(5)-glutamine methyltransferase [Bacteroides mediterraneensis]HJH66002.1 peptide chain release factor N(5)-glutamine methyltransferase [Bacteroides mediterraneensis]